MNYAQLNDSLHAGIVMAAIKQEKRDKKTMWLVGSNSNCNAMF